MICMIYKYYVCVYIYVISNISYIILYIMFFVF